MSGYQPVQDMEYVYNADGTEEFRKVKITLEIGEKGGRVTLEPEHMMTLPELNRVMKDYENDLLDRMMTDYDNYYPVRIVYNGMEMKVEFDSRRDVIGIAII